MSEAEKESIDGPGTPVAPPADDGHIHLMKLYVAGRRELREFTRIADDADSAVLPRRYFGMARVPFATMDGKRGEMAIEFEIDAVNVVQAFDKFDATAERAKVEGQAEFKRQQLLQGFGGGAGVDVRSIPKLSRG